MSHILFVFVVGRGWGGDVFADQDGFLGGVGWGGECEEGAKANERRGGGATAAAGGGIPSRWRHRRGATGSGAPAELRRGGKREMTIITTSTGSSFAIVLADPCALKSYPLAHLQLPRAINLEQVPAHPSSRCFGLFH